VLLCCIRPGRRLNPRLSGLAMCMSLQFLCSRAAAGSPTAWLAHVCTGRCLAATQVAVGVCSAAAFLVDFLTHGWKLCGVWHGCQRQTAPLAPVGVLHFGLIGFIALGSCWLSAASATAVPATFGQSSCTLPGMHALLLLSSRRTSLQHMSPTGCRLVWKPSNAHAAKRPAQACPFCVF
jgi:hypothetical protein